MESTVKQSYDKMREHVSKYFTVTLKNDWFEKPDKKRHDEMLYVYSYGPTKVGYLYYKLGKTDEYASFEWDPKYIGNEKVDLSGYEMAEDRTKFPQKKLIFRSFGAVQEKIDELCSIMHKNFSERKWQ